MRAALDGYIPPLLVISVAVLLMTIRWHYGRDHSGCTVVWGDVVSMVAMVSVAALLELAMGRTLTYKYGGVRLWAGDIHSNQNSQHIADPYSVTHCIHGAAFYGLTRAVMGSRRWGQCALVAVTLEAAWEVLENTAMVIHRYRTATIALDYDGDSIVNSMGDILASVLGFILAWRLPTRVTMLGIVLAEILLAWCIHDNLTLNLLMLLSPW